jgi:two-component system, OmpR family, response regulator
MAGPHVLLVDDDGRLREIVGMALEGEGYRVSRAESAEDAMSVLDQDDPDLMILDVMLPGRDGFELCRDIRKRSPLPILMLTAKTDTVDVVVGLESGADDYVTKPFHMEELLARVRALLRRATGHATSELSCGPVRLDTRSGRVVVDGSAVKLTSHEYRLLSYLMHHQGRIVSRGELTEHLYDQDFDRDSNTIEVFVGRLRKKVPTDLIETVRGLGYRIVTPNNAT